MSENEIWLDYFSYFAFALYSFQLSVLLLLLFCAFLGEFAIAISVAVFGFKVCCLVGALNSCAVFG